METNRSDFSSNAIPVFPLTTSKFAFPTSGTPHEIFVDRSMPVMFDVPQLRRKHHHIIKSERQNLHFPPCLQNDLVRLSCSYAQWRFGKSECSSSGSQSCHATNPSSSPDASETSRVVTSFKESQGCRSRRLYNAWRGKQSAKGSCA